MTTLPVEEGMSEARIDEHEDTGSVALEAHIEQRQMAFREALEKYDIVSAVHDPHQGSYVILADRVVNRLGSGAGTSHGFAEMGYTSPSPYTSWTREEWNPKLRDKQGLREYYKMKRQDGTVRGALRLVKTPVLAGRWFIKPGSDSATDKKIAQFVEDNLFTDLNVTWSVLLQDILLMCEYGYMAFEKVWKQQDGKIVLQKLAPRHPLDIQEWEYDANGGPNGIVMEPTPALQTMGPPIRIPISKLAVFALEPEAGDLRGISILRSAYKHYYYKDTLYKIDAIQKERHGIGVPVIKLPPGFTPTDKALAENLGRNLRTNERAHVVLPPNWELIFAALEGQPVDCITSIDHHDKKIMSNILAPFLDDSSVDPKSTDMFLKSTRYIGQYVIDIFNKFIIKELVNLNFTLGKGRKYPTLQVRRVGEQEDLRTNSFTLRNLVGAGAIIPDDPLEDFLREELDLPARDPETSRDIVEGDDSDQDVDQKDQQTSAISRDKNQTKSPKPGRTGLPRQAGTPEMKPGRTTSGRDTSGGK